MNANYGKQCSHDPKKFCQERAGCNNCMIRKRSEKSWGMWLDGSFSG
jgi:hypothetical protein